MLRLADDVKESLSLRSAHEILELLSIWKSVSVRELCEFTGYSRNQVYQALSKLVEAGLVRKRGQESSSWRRMNWRGDWRMCIITCW